MMMSVLARESSVNFLTCRLCLRSFIALGMSFPSRLMAQPASRTKDPGPDSTQRSVLKILERSLCAVTGPPTDEAHKGYMTCMVFLCKRKFLGS